MPSPTVAAVLPAFLEWAHVNLAPSTVYAYRLYLTRFARDRGELPLDQLTPADVKTWSTKWHPLQAVQRFASWATFEARLVREHPLARLKLPAVAGRSRILSRAELVALLRRSCAAFRRLLIALRETIARPQELRGVRWGDIRRPGNQPADVEDLVAGVAFFAIRNYKGKARRKGPSPFRAVPISRRLGRSIARLIGAGPAPNVVVFLNTRGRPWSANAVRCQMRRLRLRVHLVADLDGEKVVAYSIRHTQATAMVRAGVRDLVLAEVMGHTSPRMTARYVHLVPDDLSAAIRRLERPKGQISPKPTR